VRRLTFFLAAVLLVLVAEKAPCHEITFSIDPNDRNSLGYSEMRLEEADPLSIRRGRFLSIDPTWDSADRSTPQSWNRYAYVMNNSVNMTDPDGKCPSSLTGRPCANPLNGSTLVLRTERNNPIMGEFGMTRNQGAKPHQGVDLLSKQGTPVTAADGGRIVFAGVQKGHGNIVIVAHQNSAGKDVSFTSYSHLDSFKVKGDDTVKPGQQIGSVGRSGNLSSGIPTHLHFEIRKVQEPGKGEQALKKRVDPGPELGLESKKKPEQ
jgi:RHS repeat-associated protein